MWIPKDLDLIPWFLPLSIHIFFNFQNNRQYCNTKNKGFPEKIYLAKSTTHWAYVVLMKQQNNWKHSLDFGSEGKVPKALYIFLTTIDKVVLWQQIRSMFQEWYAWTDGQEEG
jgi:hypothetical protein